MPDARRLVAALVVFACGFRAATAVEAPAPADPGPGASVVAPVDWRVDVRCGVNCVYVMLRMLDRPVTYGELLGQTAVGEQGSNAGELARVAGLHGVVLTPVHATAGSVARWPTPAIVHIQRPSDFAGHYVLYLGRVADKYHRVLDCTSGSMSDLSDGDFNAQWTGYALLRGVPQVQALAPWVARGWLAAGILVFIASLVRWHQQRRAAPVPA
jgi:hypothetical protein